MEEEKKNEVEEEEKEETEEEKKEEEKEEVKKDSEKEQEKDRFGRTLYATTCSDCGKETKVPFEPSGDKPVYCMECYQKHRPKRSF